MKSRKGFTLVELLVVIAILAILATASIIGFTAFTKKAQVSNDSDLVAQLNKYALAAGVSKDFKTVTDIRDELVESGFELANLKLEAEKQDYVIGFDVAQDKFVLLKGTEAAEGYEIDKKINVFAFVKTEEEATRFGNAGFSLYLQNGYDKATLAAKTGVDVGENAGITSISYTNEAAQEVVIRTNGGTLTINAGSDTVNHYGEGLVLNIQAIAGSSYHEFGHFPKATIAQGRMVVEDKGQVEIVNVTGSGVVLDEVGTGSIELCYASSNENVPTGTANVEATVAAIVMDDIVARTENGAYTTLTAALNNLGTSKTLFIVADFSETFTAGSGTSMYTTNHDFTMDGQGHTIDATFVVNNNDTKIFMDISTGIVNIKNLNIVGVGIKYIFVADDDVELTFENVNIVADNCGVSASNGHLVARNCSFRFVKGDHTRNDHQEAWAPVSAQYGGTVELFDCILTSSDGYGMLIWPSGGTLEATRCSITSAKGYAVSWARNGAGSNTRSDSIVRVNNCTLEGSTSCEAKYNGTSDGGTEAYIYKDGVLVATTVSE